MRVLVTGSSGFVGSHIVDSLTRAGVVVIGLDMEPPMHRQKLDAYVQCDVADGDRLAIAIANAEPEAIVHAAAITPVADDAAIASHVFRVNAGSTAVILGAMAGIGCPRLVFLSSAGVYRDPEPGAELHEDSPVADGGSLYAQTKLASERLCLWARRETGILATALRVGPVYGEHERPTSTRGNMSPIYRAIRLVRGRQSLICNDWDAPFNWIHGDDVGLAVSATLEADHPGAVYNIAGPKVSIRQTVEAVARLVPQASIDWSPADTATLPVRVPYRPMVSELAASELGFSPTVTLNEGVSRVVRSL